MKKVCVVTATRAEYGILHPLLVKLFQCHQWQIQLVVTGTHLLEEFGYTIEEIQQDSLPIHASIPIVASGDDALAVSETMAAALQGFGAYFKKETPDMVVLLGDRTEMLAIAAAAMNWQIPIAHIHGGELTQGVVDDCVRHAITKLSYLHFASTEEYRRRIIQMGEDPGRVFNVGALGVENIKTTPMYTLEELREWLDFPVDKNYAVVTFHPITLGGNTATEQLEELLAAMAQWKDYYFLITKANADAGGKAINARLEQECTQNNRIKLVSSLGMKGYLSAVKYAEFVMGNSSSGIIEAPALAVPTVNIGDRQKGRIMAESVITCEPTRAAILQAMEQAVEKKGQSCANPYGAGDTSDKIIQQLKRFLGEETIDLKKRFFDIDYEIKG